MRTFLLLALSVGFALPAFAGDTASPPPPATPPASQTSTDTAYMNEIVCKKMPPPTGTRLGGRNICLTRAQWQNAEQRSQDTIRNVQDRGGMDSPAAAHGGGG